MWVKPDEVRGDVGQRVLEAVADAGLGGEVDHALEGGRERRLNRRPVGEVGAQEAPVGPAGAVELGQPRLLERHVVVVVDVVEARHGVAARQQRPGDVKADEAGGAGDQDPHQAAEDAAGGGSASPRPMA